jgi:predicted AAA+ superfamily ATPase
VVVATGSSANDLYRGVAERWPGRRGAGVDHLVLPQSFAAFARATVGHLPESPRMGVADLMTPRGHDLLIGLRAHQRYLADALDLYLRFGGLPAAVAEAASGRQEPTAGTLRIVLDSILREVRRKGASESAVHALLERIARSLGSTVSWAAMARDMDVPLGSIRRGRARGPSDKTVRDYVEFLATGYFAMVLYGWKSDLAGSDLARERKVYFGDPLLYRLARARAGLAEDRPALVENIVALSLLRRYEPEDLLLRGFAEPTSLHLWRSRRGGEIDFLCGPRSAVEAVEVKYQEHVDRRALAGLRAAFPGRPAVVTTMSELDLLDASAGLVPVSMLLWAVG